LVNAGAVRRFRLAKELHQVENCGGHLSLRHERAEGGKRKAGDGGLSTVTRRNDGEHTGQGCLVHRLREVVIEGGAVDPTQRHVDDIDVVIYAAVSIGIRAKSSASMIATPLQAVVMEEHTFSP
jgi:hypothetical protein